MKKLNLYTIHDEIVGLKNYLYQQEMDRFKPIDYKEYIKMSLEGFEMFFKYDGVYYKNAGKLYAALKLNGFEKDVRTLRAMIEASSRIDELWSLKVNIVYASYRESVGYWLVCDGSILTKESLSIVRGNPYNSEFNMIRNGERIIFNRATAVYNVFVEDSDVALYHIDGFYGNCGVDNLLPRI